MTAPTEQELKNIIGTIHNFKSDNLDKAIQMADGSIRMAMIYADNLWFSVFNSIKKSLFKSLPANNVFPAQILKDKYFDGSLTHSEYMFVLHLLCSKAIADNAKFSASHGHHTSAFASGIIFDKIHELFIKAEEYNFTAQEVIERVIAHLDYYHYIKQEVTYGS